MRFPFACAILAVWFSAASAPAAGLRFSGESTLHSVELRELKVETIDLADAPGSGSIRRLSDGRWVECDEGDSTCIVYGSAAAGTAQLLLHDLRVNGWARGGWSISGRARLRQEGGDEGLWPRADDEFDLLSLRVEYRRTRWHARAGRQWRQSALGIANFDGGLVSYHDRDYGGTVWAGRSLLRSAFEPIDGDALAAVDRLAPNESSRLFGGSAQWRWQRSIRVSGAYERELRDDRKGFQSERVALDGFGSWRDFGATLRWQRDLSSARNNELYVGLRSPSVRQTSAMLSWRRHKPYFEAWTIWNVFAPVGFDEFAGRVDWMSTRWPVEVGLHAARREYEEANTGLQFAPLRDDGWNAGAQVQWHLSPRWQWTSSYRADIGPGEARSQLLAQLTHQLGPRRSLSAFFTGFDYVREYRVSGHTVLGGGLRADWELPHQSSIFGSFAHYSHDADGGTDFGQTRVQLGVRWQFGSNPRASR